MTINHWVAFSEQPDKKYVKKHDYHCFMFYAVFIKNHKLSFSMDCLNFLNINIFNEFSIFVCVCQARRVIF